MVQKKFRYEIQKYQEDCISNIISIFEKFQQNIDKRVIFEEHYRLNNYNFYKFAISDSSNIDILMETGTGKTFTYIKTIFELRRNFGYKKFIILVPSVAIREGVKTQFEDTKDYFRSLYANETEKEIRVFVYEGGNTSVVRQFITTSNLSVLIMTPSSFRHKDNILNRPLEEEIHDPQLFETNSNPPKSYLECLKRLHPIVIIDEPHRFDGDAFKKYFEGFDNFYLRFGATFPNKKDSLPLSNVAYVLDSISSFRQSLVKKIVVYTQDSVENKDTLVGIEDKKAIVNTISNGVVIRRELGIGSIFNGKSIKKINKDNIVLSADTIETIDYSLSDESIRSMIRQTIKIHFEKEQILFEKGIKALTLFFIPNDISLYRGDNARIKKFFEEEYILKRDEIINSIPEDSDYYKYLKNDFDNEGNLQIHKGYFSGDKGNKDEKIQAGVDEILNDKKRLLSFESPTRFIFSIWALQEGWDNPNVFTICKLSNQGSDISKLQQIGRGLRICVNQELQRQTLKTLNEDQELFWKLNNLDVIVSGKEQGFVESIQREILNNSFLIPETFGENELKKLIKERGKFDDTTTRNLFKKLDENELIIFKGNVDGIDIYEKSPDYSIKLKQLNLPIEQTKVLENIFASDAKTYAQKASKKKNKNNLYIKPTHLKEFQDLWNTINKNSFYILDNLNEEEEKQLIYNIRAEIEKLNIEEILLQTIRTDINVRKIDQENAITKSLVNTISYKSKVDYIEFVHAISNSTKTPLSFVVKIFNTLSINFREKILCNNPERAQNEISEIIKKHLIAIIKTNIKYDGIDGVGLPNIFKKDKDRAYLEPGTTGKYQKDIEKDFSLKTKWIFEDIIEYDSDFELDIVEGDPDIESIEIFAKLPRLKIKTPLGEYSPDFCYVIKNKDGHKLYLIVEAKGYNTYTEIPTSEKDKIDFAKKYFEELTKKYNNDNVKIIFKERINRTELIDLIKQV
ncbi:MAG: DEAD/DEAH box helicase family protein [Candidatus Dojkabacteria bacterium]|nr:DEAD/DEAH box helicase family protein [Candidatus Dojkabacteria bacterium]